MGFSDPFVDMFDSRAASPAWSFFDKAYVSPLLKLPEAAGDVRKFASYLRNKLRWAETSDAELSENADAPGVR